MYATYAILALLVTAFVRAGWKLLFLAMILLLPILVEFLVTQFRAYSISAYCEELAAEPPKSKNFADVLVLNAALGPNGKRGNYTYLNVIYKSAIGSRFRWIIDEHLGRNPRTPMYLLEQSGTRRDCGTGETAKECVRRYLVESEISLLRMELRHKVWPNPKRNRVGTFTFGTRRTTEVIGVTNVSLGDTSELSEVYEWAKVSLWKDQVWTSLWPWSSTLIHTCSTNRQTFNDWLNN